MKAEAASRRNYRRCSDPLDQGMGQDMVTLPAGSLFENSDICISDDVPINPCIQARFLVFLKLEKFKPSTRTVVSAQLDVFRGCWRVDGYYGWRCAVRPALLLRLDRDQECFAHILLNTDERPGLCKNAFEFCPASSDALNRGDGPSYVANLALLKTRIVMDLRNLGLVDLLMQALSQTNW